MLTTDQSFLMEGQPPLLHGKSLDQIAVQICHGSCRAGEGGRFHSVGELLPLLCGSLVRGSSFTDMDWRDSSRPAGFQLSLRVGEGAMDRIYTYSLGCCYCLFCFSRQFFFSFLCSLVCSETLFVDKTGLGLTDPPASASECWD